MDNRVAGCQPPAGATPLLRFGLPSPPGVIGMVMAPGVHRGIIPSMLCVSVALVVACVVGAVLPLGRRVVGAPRAYLPCGRRLLCVGEVPVWWVWPPP